MTDPAPHTARPDLTLHIDALRLEGFPPAQQTAIAAAIERELGRLLAERGLPAAWQDGAAHGHIPHLDGGSFTGAADATPHAIGAQIASAVYEGMSDAR